MRSLFLTCATALAFCHVLTGCGPIPKVSVPSVPDRLGVVRVNTNLLAKSLHRAIDAEGKIQYAQLRGDTDLTHFLEEVALQRMDAFNSRSEQLAFWLNAHNALMLDLIRSNISPVKPDVQSLRSADVCEIGGKKYSLQRIEQGILVNDFREPRAFFALFPGMKSGPPLAIEPYTEEKLSDQLDHAVRSFLADSTKNRLDIRHNTLYLDALFSDDEEPLSLSAGTLVAFVRAFAPPSMAGYLDAHSHVTVSFAPHDWTLY